MSAAQLMEAMGKSALATTIALTLHPKLTEVRLIATVTSRTTHRARGPHVEGGAAAGFGAAARAGRSRS